MSLFGQHRATNSQLNSKLLGYNVQTSIFGSVIPWGYGTHRLPGNVIWTGDWQAIPVKQGHKGILGKGSSGGKGGNSSGDQLYTYKTAIEIGIMQGPVTAIRTIWADKTKMAPARSNEAYTISGGGGTYNPINKPDLIYDDGVVARIPYSVGAADYGSPGSVTLTGTQSVPMTPVSSSPGHLQYVLNPDGSYTFSAADGGIPVVINYTWTQTNTSNDGQPLQNLSLTFFNGAFGQSPWSYMTTNHPDQALGYSELCKVANQAMELNAGGLISNYSYEITAFLPFGGGILDAEISALVDHFLTVGLGIDPGSIGPLTAMANYCLANGLFISPFCDQQRTAADWLNDWLMIANVAPVYSEGLLKFRPWGDTTAVGNGATFTPDTAPIYDLGDDDYIANGKDDPLLVDRPTVRDAYNSITVEFANRGNSYNIETIPPEQDDNAINLYGIRPAPVLQLHCITSPKIATLVANTQLKRSVNVRAQFRFALGAQYSLLEPMDMLTLTDPYLGLDHQPVRILDIEEDEGGKFSVLAEEFPWGTARPTLHPKEVNSSFGPGYFSEPGDTYAPIFFEAPLELTQQVGYELFIGLAGASQWGGCRVWVSTDKGVSYQELGNQQGPAIRGFCSAALAAAADPDSSHTLSVDLTESDGTLDSFTQDQADNNVALVVIDQEVLSYATAALTGSSTYDLTYLRRGVYDSPVQAHQVDAPFLLLDDRVFIYRFQDSDIGHIRQFKFTSFNKANQQEQNLADVQPYEFRIAQPRPPYPWKPSYTNPDGDNFPDLRKNFGITQAYDNGPDGPLARIAIRGNPTLNVPSQLIAAPSISVVLSTTGGSITGGTKFVLGVAAWDADTTVAIAKLTLANLTNIEIPAGTNTNKVTLTVTWAPGSWGGPVFAGLTEEKLALLAGMTPGQTSLVITSLVAIDTWSAAVPVDPLTDHLVFQTFEEVHGGIWGGQITAKTGTTITLGGPSFAQNFAGRYVTLYAAKDITGEIPFVSRLISSNAGNVLTLASTSFLSVGDVVVIRNKATTFTALTIGDALFSNDAYPAGLTANSEVGAAIRIISGKGAGQPDKTIASHTSTVYTVGDPFFPVPDATSVFIVISQKRLPDQAMQSYKVSNFGNNTGRIGNVQMPNRAGSYLVQAIAYDSHNNGSNKFLAMFREVYLWGRGPGYYVDSIVSNAVTIDLVNGWRHEIIANQAAAITINTPTWTGGIIQPGDALLTIIFVQDATGGRPKPIWSAGFSGIAGFEVDGTPNTYSIFKFVVRADGKFALNGNAATGLPV